MTDALTRFGFECRCSSERVERALRIAGPGEVEAALAERGHVEVICECCNRRYAFAPDEARALFPAAGDSACALQ